MRPLAPKFVIENWCTDTKFEAHCSLRSNHWFFLEADHWIDSNQSSTFSQWAIGIFSNERAWGESRLKLNTSPGSLPIKKHSVSRGNEMAWMRFSGPGKGYEYGALMFQELGFGWSGKACSPKIGAPGVSETMLQALRSLTTKTSKKKCSGWRTNKENYAPKKIRFTIKK